MAKTVAAVLENSGVLKQVLLSSEIETVLEGLKIVRITQGQPPQDGDTGSKLQLLTFAGGRND